MVPSRRYYNIVGYSTIKTATQPRMLSLTKNTNPNPNSNCIPNRVNTMKNKQKIWYRRGFEPRVTGVAKLQRYRSATAPRCKPALLHAI